MEESKTLVEQLREIVEKSREYGGFPTDFAELFIGRRVECSEEERELFTAIADRIEREYLPLPLDADSMPIKTGDNVFFIEEDEPHEVFGFLYENGESLVHIGRRDGTSTDAYVKPEELTHDPTDTLERIEEDARKMFKDYWGCGDAECHCCPAMVDGKTPYERYESSGSCTTAQKLDLLRRQREVLKRGQE